MQNTVRRWFLFLPVTILCTFLIALIIEIIASVIFANLGASPDDSIFKFFRYVFEGFFCGFVFLFIGGYIAPNKAGRILLLTIQTFLFLINLVSIFTSNHSDYWNLLFSVLLLIGGYLANQQLIEEEKIKIELG